MLWEDLVGLIEKFVFCVYVLTTGHERVNIYAPTVGSTMIPLSAETLVLPFFNIYAMSLIVMHTRVNFLQP